MMTFSEALVLDECIFLSGSFVVRTRSDDDDDVTQGTCK